MALKSSIVDGCQTAVCLDQRANILLSLDEVLISCTEKKHPQSVMMSLLTEIQVAAVYNNSAKSSEASTIRARVVGGAPASSQRPKPIFSFMAFGEVGYILADRPVSHYPLPLSQPFDNLSSRPACSVDTRRSVNCHFRFKASHESSSGH